VKFKGAGIAFALSFASAVNIAFLFIFLRKKPNINLKPILQAWVIYSIKLLIFSAIATVPVLITKPFLLALFADNGRIISQGVPVLINAVFFAAIGVSLLYITRDKQLRAIISMFRKTSPMA
jgi:putative peptidoglycan lipid II flippase